MSGATTFGEFLHQHRRAFLFCWDRANVPIGYPMQTLAFADGSLLFTAYTKSAKVRNLRANPAVTCLVVSDDDPMNTWVSVRGRASTHRPSLCEVDTLVPASSPDPRVPKSVVDKVRDRLVSGKRCIIRVRVDEIVGAAGVGCG